MQKENITRENYQRVTSILYPFSGLEKVPKEILENAAERGTRVHHICEAIIRGLGEFDIDEVTEGYVESFKKWWEQGHTVKMIEERFWDDELKITGQVDLILEQEEGLAIVDLKTSYKPSKTWAAQGAAYAYLAKKAGLEITKIFFLHLKKDGSLPSLYEYPVDDNFFFSIHRTWEHFYKKAK